MNNVNNMKCPNFKTCNDEKNYHCHYDPYRCLHSKLVEKTLIPREWKDALSNM